MTTDKAIKALLEGKGIQLPEWNQLFYVKTENGIVLTDKEGHQAIEVHVLSRKGDFVLASIKGITDRTAAEAFKGLNLYIHRDQLPEDKNAFYYCDLIGMTVLENGHLFGTVVSVQNYGAGDVIEVKTTHGRTFAFDFSKATFPRVDVAARQMDIVMPKGMEEVVHEV